MGIHAVSQRQLGNSSTIFTSEVIGDGLVVLSGVCEGLRYYKYKFTHKGISTTEIEQFSIKIVTLNQIDGFIKNRSRETSREKGG